MANLFAKRVKPSESESFGSPHLEGAPGRLTWTPSRVPLNTATLVCRTPEQILVEQFPLKAPSIHALTKAYPADTQGCKGHGSTELWPVARSVVANCFARFFFTGNRVITEVFATRQTRSTITLTFTFVLSTLDTGQPDLAASTALWKSPSAASLILTLTVMSERVIANPAPFSSK